MNGKGLIEDFGEFVKALPESVRGSMRYTRLDGVLYQVEILSVGSSEMPEDVEADDEGVVVE